MLFDSDAQYKQSVGNRIASIGGIVEVIHTGEFLLQATLTPEQLLEVVHYNEVHFVDRCHPAGPLMHGARAIAGANYVEHVAGYTGEGVVGEVVDQWDPQTMHRALTGRCVGGTFPGEPCDEDTDCGGGDCQRAPTPHRPNVDSLVSKHGTCSFGVAFGDGTGGQGDLDYGDGDWDRFPGKGMLPEGQGIFADYCNFPEAEGLSICAPEVVISRKCYTCELVCSDCRSECAEPCGGPDNVYRDDPYRAVFQSNSWGNEYSITYDTWSDQLDETVLAYDLLVCQAQGNSGKPRPQDPHNPTPTSTSQAWAKNVVSIGGVCHRQTLSMADDQWGWEGEPEPASYGPAPDGRIKPDLTHFYHWVYTTDEEPPPDDYYISYSGTSAATPIVSGHFGLFFQMWADDRDGDGKGIFGNPLLDPDCDAEVENCVFKNRPHAATAKAMMINTARPYEFSWLDYPDPPGPPNEDLKRDKQGWGLPSVGKLYALRHSFVVLVDETFVLSNLQAHGYAITVPPHTAALKATLVYTDPPGSVGAETALQNNLNLFAAFWPDPDNYSYHGNYGLVDSNWSTPGGEPNTVDNVENIFIKEPVPGAWSVSVDAENITMDAHLETPGVIDADYALVVSLDFDCNGNGILDSEEIADNYDPPVDANDNGTLDECEAEAPVEPSDESGYPKNRYISLVPQNPGMQTALRVTLTDLPAPFEAHEGCTLWVGPPSDISELPGKSDATPPIFKRAELQTTQYCMDWSTVGTLHVADDEIVPSAVYHVQTINCATNPFNELSYSAPLAVSTSKWGDVCGLNSQTQPQGTVDFNDVDAVVDKFYNRNDPPMKARSDVAPDLPDKIVDFTDIPAVVDAFQGEPYPYNGADECP